MSFACLRFISVFSIHTSISCVTDKRHYFPMTVSYIGSTNKPNCTADSQATIMFFFSFFQALLPRPVECRDTYIKIARGCGVSFN